jgi:hypothetical protein
VFDVVGFLHQYIKMLRTIGPQEWVFKELQSISNMEFQFAEEIAAADHVVTLSSTYINLLLSPPFFLVLQIWGESGTMYITFMSLAKTKSSNLPSFFVEFLLFHSL